MSAFLVNSDHIAEIAKQFDNPQLSINSYNPISKARLPVIVKVIARELAKANILSLKTRYPSSWQDFLPEVTQEEFESECAVISTGKPRVDLDHVYRMCLCYNYQACESTHWITSDAYWLIHHLMNAIAYTKFDNNIWEWHPEGEIK